MAILFFLILKKIKYTDDWKEKLQALLLNGWEHCVYSRANFAVRIMSHYRAQIWADKLNCLSVVIVVSIYWETLSVLSVTLADLKE